MQKAFAIFSEMLLEYMHQVKTFFDLTEMLFSGCR